MSELAQILMADDEETFLHSTADLLRRAGYGCEIARDAEAATALLDQKEYDLLIADIKMPGNAELEFIKEIPQIAPGVPVILVTGYPSLHSAIQSVQLPVVAYLVKPLDFDELLGHVRSGIEQFRIYRSLHSSRRRLQDWRQELEDVEKSMRQTASDGSDVPIDAFLTLTLRNIAGSLEDLRHLTESLAVHSGETYVCQLFNCPRSNALTAALEETIEVLEKTKSSFKSKELGQLRRKLEALLKKEVR